VLKHKARVVVSVFVIVDVLATAVAWLAAFYLRFDFEPLHLILPVTKGRPDLERYLVLLPLIAILWPVVLSFHGLYRLRRSRSRIDEFFAILVSVLVSTALLIGATLYVRVYYRYQPEVAPYWEFSQVVFAFFVVMNTATLVLGRAALRRYLQRRWSSGQNAERVLIAGAGPLGRAVAETILAHGDLGYAIVGFLDDHETGPVLGRPVLGPLSRARELAGDCAIDEIFVALPVEEHTAMLGLIRAVRNECVDVRVVPDLLQYATLQATLEDLDGLPIITLNSVPLLGFSSMAKRVIDIVLGGAVLLLLTFVLPVFPLIALLIKLKGGRGPIFYRQERMSLDGKKFQMFKFRSMREDAERETGPVFASEQDPRRTGIGIWLRKRNLDELPQLINVVLGDMSLVGPRPERPAFVRRFRETIPQYMLRHRVKTGITGWAQVNGWRGNTSIEKRIEYDLYYIENWSLFLDLKIMILTLFRGFGQRHAY
jgi:Undecaprenyl-phosphate glucose phosphotransferase